jgi:ABC-type phosphate transport system substrate-binding protein
MLKTHLAHFISLAAVSACSSIGVSTEPSATPDLSIPTIAVSVALEPWVAAKIIAYRDERAADGSQVPVEFRLEAFSTSTGMELASQAEAEILIAGIDPPEGWFSAPLGWERIAVIVNPNNPLRAFSIDSLEDIFLGRVSDWEILEGREGSIQPVIPLVGDELRTKFGSVVLNEVRFSTAARLAPSPPAMIEIVGGDSGAIGFIPLVAYQSEVSIVRVDGQLPSEDDYPMIMQVVAMAPTEPSGAIREWLGWMQAGMISDQ